MENHCEPKQQASELAAVVVGAGSAGIAVLGNLLELLPPNSKIGWVDPLFQGGRINAKYREVPSNTKVCHFLSYGEGVEPFRKIAETTEKPNAISILKDLPRNGTCSLQYAGDMLLVLTEGLLKHDRVTSFKGSVADSKWNSEDSVWSLTIQDEASNTTQHITAPLVAYCTGAFPTTVPFPTGLSRVPELLDLDITLKPSLLAETIPRDQDICVGVVGASHSAILVLKNVFELSQKSHPKLRARWFSRAKRLKYAEDKGDWILFDNTGLKGIAAKFAEENLDGDRLLHSDVGKIITRVDCSGGQEQERQAYLQEMPGCDYVTQAIGYNTKPLPMKQEVSFNHETGGFIDPKTKQPVPGLYGAGIGFPEKVIDPVGNVEYAVGFIKFMRFLKRVVPAWVGTNPN
ncbi:pyridine nucleotide-disulfide oxidoreductase-domain-containing protein [Annulohypoxylon bovei var. microspora]|nr:pyridine nucleotide-disulfide oxidoreductase-domain-containing protein [Annulohypoxylon bovei var. microspora]